MRLGRRSLIALVTTVTTLAGAFDGCLLDCHASAPVQDTQATAHAHCRPAPAQQAGLASTELRAGRWQTDPACHHDHTSAAAESTAHTRLDSRTLGILASFEWHPDRPVASTLPVMRSTVDGSAPATDCIPLRI
jgi:hypothetical protein